MVGGMHNSPRFGLTRRMIEEDGFTPSEVLSWITDEGASAPAQAGAALSLVGDALDRLRPDALLLVGDRFETAAAALAATLAGVPIVHLHGGEETEGALDNAFRHAITKLSHLHLVSHEEHAARVIGMGEDPGTVHVVGAPGLDNLHREDLAQREELESVLDLHLEPPVVLVTLHPATAAGDPAAEAAAVIGAMERVTATYVVTLPNTDPGNESVRAALLATSRGPRRSAVEALGERRFWGLMKLADAMLGNSSAALIEAPALALPAVNVGDRQRGRLRGGNVLDAPAETSAITLALERALEPTFRRSLAATASPYGDGRAGQRIVAILSAWRPPRPPIKSFRSAA